MTVIPQKRKKFTLELLVGVIELAYTNPIGQYETSSSHPIYFISNHGMASILYKAHCSGAKMCLCTCMLEDVGKTRNSFQSCYTARILI